MEVLWNHKNILLDQKSFFPIVSSCKKANTQKVILSASPTSRLDWNDSVVVNKDKHILWHIDFAYAENFDPTDEIAFSSRKLACKTFYETVWPSFTESSIGILAYQGPVQEFGDASEKVKRQDLFLEKLCEELMLFSHNLPEIPVMLAFDVAGIPLLDFLYLFRRERFEHFVLALKGSSISFPSICWENGYGKKGFIGDAYTFSKKEPEKVGILLNSHFDKNLENLCFQLQKEKIPFRILYEDFATEEWDELDDIICFEELSKKAYRIIKGFEAAGGNSIIWSKDFTTSRLFKYRGRGI